MINKISFKNFKIFKEKQTVDLKPITIIMGKNNSGKSAILKLMPLIEGALNGKNTNPIEINNGGVILGNEYKDLIYGNFSRALELDLVDSKSQIQLRTEIVVDTSIDIPIIESWGLKNNGNPVLNLIRHGQSALYFNEIDENEYRCGFEGLYLGFYAKKETEDSSEDNYNQPYIITDYIGALRAKAEPYYDLNPETEKSGINGRYLYDFLIRDYLTMDKKYFNSISNWIADNFEGWKLSIDVDSVPYHIQLKKDKLEINLTDTGMGISQSLPLVIRAFRKCLEETLIVIEEPEAHLHPYAHAQLAQLFVDSINNDENKKFLIETHSQNFILRMRRLVAEKVLNQNDIAIYYVDFDQDKNESNLSEIKVDQNGGVQSWPEGIFGETLIETRAIYNAQLNDLRNVD